MLHIGCHLSAGDGYQKMGEDALSIGADTFAFFTRNPRGGQARPWNEEDAQAMRSLMARHSFAPLVAHAPYTMNLCSDKPAIREFAMKTLTDDLERMEKLPGNYYNFHPGSHMKQGTDWAVQVISDALNQTLFEGMQTIVLLETMAGKGTEVGSRFEELRAIIDRTERKQYLGVCLDTCHVYDGGYDIVHHLEDVLEEFDRIIGLERLRAVHLNDSRNPMASHKDRHEKIGKGTIGLEAIKAVVLHPRLCHLPFILETPNELDGYAEEIALLRSIAG